ncbi:MAG: twin-arginine translocase TatA/TatE family subunit [Actinobacteria bacterium]|nr:twin-arginine translocase TatA/TatE family subunit [Actinomycetota bacterium]
MFDIGAGEFIAIAIVAVLILGPDKLPKAIATVVSWTRTIREQAASARREIVAAAEIDPSVTEDFKSAVRDIGELHPRRLAASILTDDAAGTPKPPAAPGRGGSNGLPDKQQASIFDPDAT